MNYSCTVCNYTTDKKTNYTKHLLTNKHKLNITALYECISCNYTTIKKSDYIRHLTSTKHLKNKTNIINNNNDNDNDDDDDDDDDDDNDTGELKDILLHVKNQVDIQKEEAKETIKLLVEKLNNLEKKNEENTNKINETNNQNTNKINETNTQNTQKIVKEARVIKQSILTMLNTHFKNTPSIEYIKQEPFFKALEEEYKANINDGSDKLYMKIFTDFEKKKLVKTMTDLILKFVKKDDQKFQSVFNIDSARFNFATKIDDFWMNDKKGLQLRKFTVDKVVDFMIDVMDVFRLRLIKLRNENIKHSTNERSDYLMTNQKLLLEVVSFLTNSNTHSKIISQLSPNLRYNEHPLLE
jgi:hypothetical protein